MYNIKVYFRSGNKIDLFLDKNILDDFEKFYREKSATERTYYYMKNNGKSWGVIDFGQVEMVVVKESDNGENA